MDVWELGTFMLVRFLFFICIGLQVLRTYGRILVVIQKIKCVVFLYFMFLIYVYITGSKGVGHHRFQTVSYRG